MSSVLNNPTEFETALEAAFNARSKTNEAQAAAFDRYAKLRLPNRRVEGWKWSDVNAALRSTTGAFGDPVETILPASPFAAPNPLEFRIFDGRIELPAEDMPEGLRYGVMDPVATIPELETHAIATLNVAMTRKSLGLEICEGVDFERPIHIRHICGKTGFAFAQTMMRVSPGAKFHLIETFEGDGAGLYSHLFHLNVRDGGECRRTVLQETTADMVLNSICAAKVDGAEANHKPELEIYADDVECAHGSTVGALDDDALFYLRQRGLDEAQARALLVEAFVGEIIEDIADESVRAVLSARVAEWLGAQA